MPTDLIVRDVVLRDGERVDLVITDGVITEISTGSEQAATTEVDGAGALALPTFVEPHYHLDKCLSTGVAVPDGTLEEQIAEIGRQKQGDTAEAVAERATQMIELMVGFGITEIRSYADVDSNAGMTAVDGVVAAARACADIANVQVAALPQQGIFSDPGTEDRLRESVEHGVTVIGGHPQFEITHADALRHIDLVFDMAVELGLHVDMHLDETDDPGSKLLEEFSAAALRRDWGSKATAAHCTSLEAQDDYYAKRVISLAARAGITVCPNPTSSLLFRGRLDGSPMRRGLTRVRELQEAGVNVCCGQETFRSAFSRSLRIPDPVHTAQVTAYALQYVEPERIEAIFDMFTANAARAIGLDRYGIAVGHPATFNLFDAGSVEELLTMSASPVKVFKDGRVVAERSSTATLHRQRP